MHVQARRQGCKAQCAQAIRKAGAVIQVDNNKSLRLCATQLVPLKPGDTCRSRNCRTPYHTHLLNKAEPCKAEYTNTQKQSRIHQHPEAPHLVIVLQPRTIRLAARQAKEEPNTTKHNRTPSTQAHEPVVVMCCQPQTHKTHHRQAMLKGTARTHLPTQDAQAKRSRNTQHSRHDALAVAPR
jgi:hypothetical protein